MKKTKEEIRTKWIRHTPLLALDECVDNAMEEYANQCLEERSDKKYTDEQLLFVFVNGGAKAEENKDFKKLSENFKRLIEILNYIDEKN